MGWAVIEFHYRGTMNQSEMTNRELGEVVKNNYEITPEMANAIVQRILGEFFTTTDLAIGETHFTRG